MKTSFDESSLLSSPVWNPTAQNMQNLQLYENQSGLAVQPNN